MTPSIRIFYITSIRLHLLELKTNSLSQSQIAHLSRLANTVSHYVRCHTLFLINKTKWKRLMYTHRKNLEFSNVLVLSSAFVYSIIWTNSINATLFTDSDNVNHLATINTMIINLRSQLSCFSSVALTPPDICQCANYTQTSLWTIKVCVFGLGWLLWKYSLAINRK